MVNTYLANGRIHADTPYDGGFVEELKNNVPSSFREWDGDEWIVHPDYREELQRLINKYYQKRTGDIHLTPGDSQNVSSVDIWHNGYHFRSKTEARWAYFFNQILKKNRWRYEPNVYNVGEGLYLPDFYLVDQAVFVEIKGRSPSEDAKEKACRLSEKGEPVAIFVGPPYKIVYEESLVYEDGVAHHGIGLRSSPGSRFEINPNGAGDRAPGVQEALQETKGYRFN
jgi:hypothetical protein